MSPSLAVNAVDVGVDILWRRRRRGATRVAQLRRLTGSVETRSRSIFADVTFKVRRGECVGITIPGRGNDVLLGQVLSGALDPDAGQVRRSGRWVFAMGGPRLLVNGLSLRQNVDLVAGLLGYPGPVPADLEAEILESLDAVALQHRPVTDLPPALLRRVVTMTALHVPADVYCIAGGLRASSREDRQALRAAIHARLQEGATVILIARRLQGLPAERVIEVEARKRRRS